MVGARWPDSTVLTSRASWLGQRDPNIQVCTLQKRWQPRNKEINSEHKIADFEREQQTLASAQNASTTAASTACHDAGGSGELTRHPIPKSAGACSLHLLPCINNCCISGFQYADPFKPLLNLFALSRQSGHCKHCSRHNSQSSQLATHCEWRSL
jgi:hypothetical protein